MTTNEKTQKILNYLMTYADENGIILKSKLPSMYKMGQDLKFCRQTISTYLQKLIQNNELIENKDNYQVKIQQKNFIPSPEMSSYLSTFFSPTIKNVYIHLGNHIKSGICLNKLSEICFLSYLETCIALNILENNGLIKILTNKNKILIKEFNTEPPTISQKFITLQKQTAICSQGEYIIQAILEENNINYEKEKSFKDFQYEDTKQYPRYDFYLPDYNILIEYDGEHHFNLSFWCKNQETLNRIQERDKIKNDYALSHGYKLIRIPYWNKNKITIDMLLGQPGSPAEIPPPPPPFDIIKNI